MSLTRFCLRLKFPRLAIPLFAALLSVCVLLMLAGCGDSRSSSGPASGGGTGGNPSPVLSPSRFIYGGPGFEADGFSGGTINTATGAVTPLPGLFVDGLQQGNLLQILTDPRGRFVITMREQSSSFGVPIGQTGISSLLINSQTGALTLTPNSPIIFAPDGNTSPIFLDGLGRFVYQARLQSTPGFDIFNIDQTSGALTIAVPSNVAPLGGGSVGSPDGRFIFDSGSGSVQTLAVNASGQLSFVASAQGAGGGGPMAVTSDGTFLYAADDSGGEIAVFGVGTDGTLTSITGSPFRTPSNPKSLALTPDGRFLYGLFGEAVQGFAVNPSAGTFTPIAGLSAISATAITLDRAGKFAFISDINAPTSAGLVTFSIDPNTGVLTQVSTATGPVTDLATDLTTAP